MLTHLTKKPGEFRAHCRQATWVPFDSLSAEQQAEADAAGRTRWDRKLSCNVAMVQCTLETTDRAVYEAHMTQVHDPRPWANHHRLPLAVPVKMWKPPALKADGKPLTGKAAEQTQTCLGCGLVAQVDSDAAEAWFAGHLDACALAKSGAAS